MDEPVPYAILIPKLLTTVVRGFCMGAADIVPGVSGGTIALVFGIYEQLLENVRFGAKALGSLAKADVAGFRRWLNEMEWHFLLPLGAGLAAAVVALSSLIEGLLRDRPEEMAGMFFGLVLGSIVVAWRLLYQRDGVDLAVMMVVGAVTFLLLGLQSGPVADPSPLAYFGAGAVAICAMILPGISGSFLLLMMGMYAAVLGAVHDRDLLTLLVFMAGATVGLALFSTALGWLLDRHHDLVLAALIGLMVGSFRVLWPWPNGVGIISDVAAESVSGTGLELPSGDQWPAPALLGLAAFAVVVAISRLAPTPGEPSEHPPVDSEPARRHSH
jgi:putative membrane protein